MHSGTQEKVFAFAFCLLVLTSALYPQSTILDKKLKIPGAQVKTSRAMAEISRQTGQVFTYDSRIINTERIITLPKGEAPLYVFLDSITGDSSIRYSIIGRHIILYRDIIDDPETAPVTRHLPSVPLSITGSVTDAETNEPLPYATIGIKHKGRATVSNNSGNFIMKIDNTNIDDTLSISYVGYINRSVPVKSLAGNSMVITMDRDFISIPEVIIRTQDPLNIMRRAIEAVAGNYGSTPAMLTGFYREGIYRKKEPQTYSEAILKICKSPYVRSYLSDQIRILRSRKIENLDARDTLAVSLKAGLRSVIDLDGIRNTFEFMDPKMFKFFYYRVTDIVTFDEQTAYVISFEQKEWVEEPMMKGNIYINADDYAVMFTEFEVNPLYITQAGEAFISHLPKGFVMKADYIKYQVQYRNNDGRYYLSHVRGDLGFNAKGQKRVFFSHYNVFFELAVTDFSTDNIKRFDKDDIAPVSSVFAKTIGKYNSEYWKEFDFLKPEDDLIKALSSMNIRLGEFEE